MWRGVAVEFAAVRMTLSRWRRINHAPLRIVRRIAIRANPTIPITVVLRMWRVVVVEFGAVRIALGRQKRIDRVPLRVVRRPRR